MYVHIMFLGQSAAFCIVKDEVKDDVKDEKDEKLETMKVVRA